MFFFIINIYVPTVSFKVPSGRKNFDRRDVRAFTTAEVCQLCRL